MFRRNGLRSLSGGVGDLLVTLEHPWQSLPHTPTHLVPSLLPPPTPGRTFGPFGPLEVVGKGTWVLITCWVLSCCDGTTIRSLFRNTIISSSLRGWIGAGPVLGLHASTTGDQVVPGCGVHTVGLDSGPWGPGTIHHNLGVHPDRQHGHGHHWCDQSPVHDLRPVYPASKLSIVSTVKSCCYSNWCPLVYYCMWPLTIVCVYWSLGDQLVDTSLLLSTKSKLLDLLSFLKVNNYWCFPNSKTFLDSLNWLDQNCKGLLDLIISL